MRWTPSTVGTASLRSETTRDNIQYGPTKLKGLIFPAVGHAVINWRNPGACFENATEIFGVSKTGQFTNLNDGSIGCG